MGDSFWSHYHIIHMERSLRMRRITWPVTGGMRGGGKNDPRFWNLRPPFAYSLFHFRVSTSNIKPCNRRKLASSHCEGYKVHCACAVSPKTAGFSRKFKGLHIKYCHLDPQKALPYAEGRHLTYFAWKSIQGIRGVCCSLVGFQSFLSIQH